jgi:hypothetical protein
VLSGSYVYEAATTLADIEGDGKKEIIVGGRSLNPDGSLGCAGIVYVYRANGDLMWQKTVRADVNSSAAVADLNGDGYKDIVVGMGAWNADGENADNECGKNNPSAPGNGGVVALDGRNGDVLWVFDTQDWGEWGTGPNGVLDGVYSSPAVGDVNGDGKVEVVFGAWDDCIYLLDNEGNPLWGEVPIDTPLDFCGRHGFFNHDTVWSSPALADLTGDGNLEIVVGGDISCDDPNDPNRCNLYGEPNGGFVWVIRYDGTPLARKWFDQAIYSSPAIADLDNNGVLDIAVGTGQAFPGKGYYVTSMHLDLSRPLTEALVTNWQTPVAGRTFSSPALGDLNGDGVLDVVMIVKAGDFGAPPGPGASNGSYVYAMRGDNGAVLWQTHTCNNDSVGRSFPVSASPVLADITGDGLPEVIFPHAWEIAVLNPDGSYYTQVNRSNGCTDTSGSALYAGNGSFSASVAVGDLTQDGSAEIVAPGWWDEGSGSKQGVLYVWTGHPTLGNAWPMFHHDARHTGEYDYSPKPPGISVDPPALNLWCQCDQVADVQANLTIRNTGDEGFTWSLEVPSYITAYPSSGVVITQTQVLLSVPTFPSGDVSSSGTYNLGTIDIFATTMTGDPVEGSPLSIPITLRVGQPNRVFLPLLLY